MITVAIHNILVSLMAQMTIANGYQMDHGDIDVWPAENYPARWIDYGEVLNNDAIAYAGKHNNRFPFSIREKFELPASGAWTLQGGGTTASPREIMHHADADYKRLFGIQANFDQLTAAGMHMARFVRAVPEYTLVAKYPCQLTTEWEYTFRQRRDQPGVT